MTHTEYLAKQNEILYLMVKSEEFCKRTNLNELEKMIINLSKKGEILTDIKESLNGLNAPYLKYIINDFVMYNILTYTNSSQSEIKMTKEGSYYFNENCELNQEFKKKANKVIESYFIPNFFEKIRYKRVKKEVPILY